jgi:ribonuclease BN (tRNA processing enzyme)
MYTSEHADLAEERGPLTHYSPRYEDGAVIIKEALSINPNTILARDLMRIKMHRDGSHEVILPGI